MKLVATLFIITISVLQTYGQLTTKHYNGAPVTELSKNAVMINRDSALVYYNGKFYKISEFENFNPELLKNCTSKNITQPDSIAKFAKEHLKCILFLKKEDE